MADEDKAHELYQAVMKRMQERTPYASAHGGPMVIVVLGREHVELPVAEALQQWQETVYRPKPLDLGPDPTEMVRKLTKKDVQQARALEKTRENVRRRPPRKHR